MPDDEENPFENRPLEFDQKRTKSSSAQATKTQSAKRRVDPFRGKAVWERDTKLQGKRTTVRPSASGARTREALAAGFGLTLNLILFYLVGLLAAWEGLALLLGVLGLTFATLQPFFFMRESLSIQALPVSPVLSRFLAGLFAGLVGLVLLVGFVTYRDAFPVAIGILALSISAWLSTALLLYALYDVESQ